MAGGLTIELPWPAREVWPNYRQSHHWRTYAGPVKAQREEAWALALQAGAKAAELPEGHIALDVEFFPPDRRYRDDDGCIGAFKSARDGIADALGVDDRRFKPVYWFQEPSKPGKIIVRIHCGQPCGQSVDSSPFSTVEPIAPSTAHGG